MIEAYSSLDINSVAGLFCSANSGQTLAINNSAFASVNPLFTNAILSASYKTDGNIGRIIVELLIFVNNSTADASSKVAAFLEYNKIDEVTCKPNRAKRLNDDYVGFLNSSNEQIIYRDITGANKLRYDKYKILGESIYSKKFYTIPTSIDILSTK